MLGEIFYWIFNMSIASAICGIPVLLIRLIQRFPRRVSVWLWGIPFVRMLVPVGISGYGLMSLISKFTTKTVTIYEIGNDSAFTMMNYVMGANGYFPITYKVNLLENLFSIASVIWLIVALSLLLTFFIFYRVTMREIRDAQLFKDNIYFSDKIQVPSVYGIIRPKIILPREYKGGDFEYILMHEQAHAKRGDNFFRIAALILVCIHWFNPFAWLFLRIFYSDIELACDEAVLSKCNENQKKEYAHALLSSMEKSNVFAASFGGAKIRIRIENILSYRKISVFSMIGFTVLLISIAWVLLTNA